MEASVALTCTNSELPPDEQEKLSVLYCGLSPEQGQTSPTQSRPVRSSAQTLIANIGKLYYENYAIFTELLQKAKFINHVQVQTLILLKSKTRLYKSRVTLTLTGVVTPTLDGQYPAI